MEIEEKPLNKLSKSPKSPKLSKLSEAKIETAITKIEKDKITTRGYSQEDLIANISFSEMVYLLLKGELPTKKEAKILNHVLIAFCDHGVTPPSTQTSRLIASSGSKLNVALSGALLSFGKNHAGAIEESMNLFQNNMVDYQKNYDNFDNHLDKIAKDIVGDYLNKNMKIPGFGHRYHKKDPRASKLVEIAIKEDYLGPHLSLALAIEKILFKKKNIHLNVDGANGAILSDMGFSSELGFGIFMIGRIPGLIAHISEETNDKIEFRKFCNLEDVIYNGPDIKR